MRAQESGRKKHARRRGTASREKETMDNRLRKQTNMGNEESQRINTRRMRGRRRQAPEPCFVEINSERLLKPAFSFIICRVLINVAGIIFWAWFYLGSGKLVFMSKGCLEVRFGGIQRDRHTCARPQARTVPDPPKGSVPLVGVSCRTLSLRNPEGPLWIS